MTARTTSFGYGNKVDIINREGVPPPGTYNQNIETMNNKVRQRGFSFSHDKRDAFAREV